MLHIDICLVLIGISINDNFNIFIYSFFFSIIALSLSMNLLEMSLLDFLFRPKNNRLFHNLLYAKTDAEYDA